MRELLTLLRANIKKQKSTFISVALLTLIVTSVMTAIISTEDNYKNGMTAAFEQSNSGDAMVLIKTELLTDELKEKIEESSLTGQIDYYHAMIANGIECGNQGDTNRSMILKLRDSIKLYKSDLNGFEDEIPALEAGEMYVPLGLKEKIGCNVGDTVTVGTVDGEADFVIRGFVQEPVCGSQTIGFKQLFIADDEFDKLFELWNPIALKGDSFTVDFTLILLHKAEDCDLDSAKFLRKLNLETKISDLAASALSRQQSVRYSTLLPEVLIKLFIVFVIFLFVIVLILISHSISTEINSGYVTFGILKSVGFSRGKLSALFFMQYLLSELLGIAAGIVLSIPLELALSNSCKLITATMPTAGISLFKALLLIAIIIAATSAVVFIKTLPLNKISPVKAIGGGKEDIYFDSRLQMPINKRFLTASLALRQFTSAKRRYIGIVFISLILMFFMLTVNLIINLLTSSNALRVMGTEFADVAVYVDRSKADKYIPEAEELVNSVTEVTQTYCFDNTYLSVNGENLFCHIVKDPKSIPAIIKGRAPLYDNEIMITEMVGDTLEAAMGDEVTVSYGEYEGRYIVSGIFQTTFDSGMCITMSEAAINGIIDKDDDKFNIGIISFVLADSGDAEKVLDTLLEKYKGDNSIEMEKYTLNSYIGANVLDIIALLQTVIYLLSVIFALAAVRMVTSRTFLQERREIGIYKAVGFTSLTLRLGFGIRFMIAAVLGVALGIVLGLLLSPSVVGMGLSLIGLSKIPSEFNFVSVALPAVILLFCFFIFAFLSSGKVKRVQARELVME